jgi:hypothetical protein
MKYDALKEQVNKLLAVIISEGRKQGAGYSSDEYEFELEAVKGKIPKFKMFTYGQDSSVWTEAVGLYQTLVKHAEQLTGASWPVQSIDGEKFLDDAYMQVYQMASIGLPEDESPHISMKYDDVKQQFLIYSWLSDCDILGIDREQAEWDGICGEGHASSSSACFMTALLNHPTALQAYITETKSAHR